MPKARAERNTILNNNISVIKRLVASQRTNTESLLKYKDKSEAREYENERTNLQMKEKHKHSIAAVILRSLWRLSRSSRIGEQPKIELSARLLDCGEGSIYLSFHQLKIIIILRSYSNQLFNQRSFIHLRPTAKAI